MTVPELFSISPSVPVQWSFCKVNCNWCDPDSDTLSHTEKGSHVHFSYAVDTGRLLFDAVHLWSSKLFCGGLPYIETQTDTLTHSLVFELPWISYKGQGVRGRDKKNEREGTWRRKEGWKQTDGEGEVVIVLLCFPSWQLASLLTNSN